MKKARHTTPADPAAPWTQEDAEALRVAIGRFVRAGREHDLLPRPQATVLGLVDRSGSLPATITGLATLAGVRHQSMRETVRAMEAEGLLTTERDDFDRRLVRCDITERGRARHDADRRARTGWIVERIENRMSQAQRAQARQIVPLLELLIPPVWDPTPEED